MGSQPEVVFHFGFFGVFFPIILETVQLNLVVLFDIETYLFEIELHFMASHKNFYLFAILANLFSVTKYCEGFISCPQSIKLQK